MYENLSNLPELSRSFYLILFLMGGLSVFALAIFFDRALLLWKVRGSSTLSQEVKPLAEAGNFAEAALLCQRSRAAIAPLLQSALQKRGEARPSLEKTVEEEAHLILSRLEKYCRFLSLITYIAPLLGLLGTTFGFYHAFQQMSAHQEVSSLGLGSAMSFALLSTAFGIAIAIVSMTFYALLVHQIEETALALRKGSYLILETLYKKEWDDGY